MSENSEKWTPGPWDYENILKILTEGPDRWADRRNDEANARLITAAPELYTGLMHQIYRNHPYTENCDGCKQSIAALRSARGTR